MDTFTTDRIRNIALVGHSGEGKTSIAECILYNAKSTDRIGKTSNGTTVMDFDEQEIARQISVSLSVAYAVWKDVKLNLIDVPGFPDFEGELTCAMRAADAALIVTGLSGTVSVGTEKALNYCLKHSIPAFLFLNGTDKENANYSGTVQALSEQYPRRIAPLQIPIMDGIRMAGYVDSLHGRAYRFTDSGPQEIPVPEELKTELDNARSRLAEVAAENDEELLEKFFSEGSLSQEEIIRGVRIGIANNQAIPLVSGSAECNKGIFNLMDLLVECMPAPNARKVQTLDGEYDVTSDGKTVATVFKTIVDPFVGKLNLIKVLRGSVTTGTTLINSEKQQEERISSLYVLKGRKQEPVSQLLAGDIGALAKLTATDTGNTLCAPGAAVKLPPMQFPKPVYQMAVYAQKQGEEDKIFQGLYRLMDEDPTIHLEKHVETGEMLLTGLGDVHLDVITQKLKSKFKVTALLKDPKIPYRETIRKKADAEGKHKKQSGGHGQYGHVKMRFEPYPDGDFLFEEEVVGGTVPKSYIPAVEKGIRECISQGVLAGYPVVNLKAVLYDGSYHDVDSSEMAFKIAASLAYREGLKNASPVMLEPIYSLDVTVPEAFLGDIMGDLNKRRGRILGIDLGEDGRQIIHAEVPLAEILKYATDLRSMTQGRGSYDREFLRYEEFNGKLKE